MRHSRLWHGHALEAGHAVAPVTRRPSFLHVPYRGSRLIVMGMPETRYARSGDVMIAYQVVGEGPFDLVIAPGAVSHVELGWEAPDMAAFFVDPAGLTARARPEARPDRRASITPWCLARYAERTPCFRYTFVRGKRFGLAVFKESFFLRAVL